MRRPTLSVLLADDHEIVLQGVKRIVGQIPLVGPVATSLWGEDAMQQVESRTFDLCLTEIEMSRCDGFELIERIQSVSSATRIIVYTMHEEPWTIHKLAQCGVHGIVSKSSRAEELSRALDCVLAGGCHFDDRLQKRCRMEGTIFDLTQRETEVLEAIGHGCTTHEIANRLCLSVNTIETHRRNLFAKLEVRNVAELVVKAIRLGLVSVKVNTNI